MASDLDEFTDHVNLDEFANDSQPAKPDHDDFGEGFGNAVIEFNANALPGVSQLGAGLNTAIDMAGDIGNAMAGQPQISVLKQYEKHKAAQEARGQKAAKEHPWAALTAVPLAIATGAATGGLSLAKTAPMMTDVALAAGQAANQGWTDLGDITANVLGGRAVSGGIKIGAGIAKHIADTLKLPLNAIEALAERFGPTKLVKWINGDRSIPEVEAISEQVKKLKEAVAAPGKFRPDTHNFADIEQTPLRGSKQYLARDLGRAAEAGDATLGPGTSFTVKPGYGVEDEVYNVGRGATQRAATRHLGGGGGMESPFANAESDAKHLVRQSLQKAEIENQPIPKSATAGNDKPAWWGNRWEKVADPNEASRLEKLADAEMGMGRASERQRWADDSRVDTAQTVAPSDPRNADQLAGAAKTKIDQINAGSDMANSERSDAMHDVIDDAKKWQTKIAEANKEASTVAAGNKMEQDRLAGVAKQAQGRLNNISASMNALKRASGGIGGLIGLADSGPFGAFVGEGVGKRAVKAAQIASQLGQYISRDDELGRAARWASEAVDQHQLLTRAAILATMPEFQDEAQ